VVTNARNQIASKVKNPKWMVPVRELDAQLDKSRTLGSVKKVNVRSAHLTLIQMMITLHVLLIHAEESNISDQMVDVSTAVLI